MISTKSPIFVFMGQLKLYAGSLIVLLILGSNASAQYKLDYGVRIGAANYLGEMGGEEGTRQDFIWDMKLNQSKPLIGAFLRSRINHNFAFNCGATYARIQGDDALSTNPQRVGRNLNFRNDFVEVYGRAEYYFFDEKGRG